jgi:drug/metabolite transporter (DMT)-like permease
MPDTNESASINTPVGVFWSFVSAFLWGTSMVAGRHLTGDDKIDPISLSLVRFAGGGAVMLLFGVASRRELLIREWRDLLRVALLSVFGIVGMSILIFYGMQTSTAINSSMIMQLSPVFIMLLGLFIGEAIHARQVLGILLSLAGCMLVVKVITEKGLAYDWSNARGDLLVLASAACWAVYSVFGKPVVKRVGGFRATMWAMLFGAAFLFVLRLTVSRQQVWPTDNETWLVVAYIAVFPTAVAFFAWYEAMGKIDLSLLNVMQYLTPAVTIFLAWLLLGEEIGALRLLGVAVVIAGVCITSCNPRRIPRRVP